MCTFEDEVRGEIGWLDGVMERQVMALTGFTKEEIDDLGGVPVIMLNEMVDDWKRVDALAEHLFRTDRTEEERAAVKRIIDSANPPRVVLDKPAGRE